VKPTEEVKERSCETDGGGEGQIHSFTGKITPKIGRG